MPTHTSGCLPIILGACSCPRIPIEILSLYSDADPYIEILDPYIYIPIHTFRCLSRHCYVNPSFEIPVPTLRYLPTFLDFNLVHTLGCTYPYPRQACECYASADNIPILVPSLWQYISFLRHMLCRSLVSDSCMYMCGIGTQ